MKVLITGANGFLGQHLTKYLTEQNFAIIALGRGKCKILEEKIFTYYSIDLTDKQGVDEITTTVRPDIIIHTAAMSKPDECENNKDACILNNITVTGYLVEAANSAKAKIIYVSTDFVFGEDGPHSEDTIPDPLNFYGASKLQAEKLVKTNAHDYAIMRPVFIYGKVWEGLRPSFLHWVKNNLELGKPIKVVNDQFRTPTYVIDLCKGLEAMITKNVHGDFHLAGKDILTPYQMALSVADVLQLDRTLIEPVTSDTFPEPVKRSKKSGLKIDKAVEQLNYNPVDFEKGVKLTFI